jgi:hypothetical protein
VEFEDRLTIATPEGVDLELTLAGVGLRFTSALVDYLIQLLILVGLGIVLPSGGLTPDSGGFLTASWLVLPSYFSSATTSRSRCWHGAYAGQADERPARRARERRPGDIPASAVRNVLRLIDLLPGTYLVGITAISSRPGTSVSGTSRRARSSSGERRASPTEPLLRSYRGPVEAPAWTRSASAPTS